MESDSGCGRTPRIVRDGTDWHGRDAASGLYLYRLEAEGIERVRKMVLVG